VADLDVDGDMDIVAASESTGIVRSILARGDGTYSSPYSRTLAAGIAAIALADFDGDGQTRPRRHAARDGSDRHLSGSRGRQLRGPGVDHRQFAAARNRGG
jgi:hypothetical protein